MPERMRRALPAAIGLALFAVALSVLVTEVRAVGWQELADAVLRTPARRLAWALLLAGLSHAAFSGYDLVAFTSIGRSLDRRRTMLASWLACAIGNSVGFAMLPGASVRFRVYTRWGIDADDLSRVIVSSSVTFCLGLLALGGLSLALGPVASADGTAMRALVAPAGWLLTLTSVAYVGATFIRRRAVRLGPFELPIPSTGIALAQLTVSTLDWALAGAALYVLLPPGRLTFPGLLGPFLVAEMVGMASRVPGGLGVFEGVMVLLLKPALSPAEVLPALVVYRVVYYLLPLAGALVVLAAGEARARRADVARASARFGRVAELATPRVIAVFTFIAGLTLLFTGATPAARNRLAFLGGVLPLGLIEASHFLSSVAGASLLLLSQGLTRRLDAAHALAFAVVAFATVASVLKGAGWIEVALLAALLLVLWRAKPAFDRRAALFDTPLSAYWVASVVAALSTSIWLGLFAYKHVEYSNQLWWRFEVYGDASRFLRASVGAATLVLLFTVSRLLRHAPPETCEPTDADLADAARAVAAQTSAFPNLVYLRDKALLFNEQRTAFVMYAVQGRTWVALGDPVGPPECHPGLIRSFLERCDDYGGIPVFYEVRKDHLHHYADFGLAVVKIGEEAVVDLSSFTLEGGHAGKLRQMRHRFEREGGRFRVVPAAEVPEILGELREVSDEWLRSRPGGEKGFSLGYFDPAYLSRFPVAVIEGEGRILAFASLWPGPNGIELSSDLMRHRHDAPKAVMEILFVHLLEWGKEQGYQRFALGMAPLSGVETSPVAPLWNRLGAFLYEHGEKIYRFQGLRAFKDKFGPAWEPRYLAYVGGMRLPHILADVSALIAGGYRKIFLG
jgi:phosphatidylglycerol lysyltransferase